MRRLHRISLFTVLLLVATSLHAGSFPLREMFPKVAPIELETLYQQRENVIIVDVRSASENGIADTLTYDAGIFDWARSYPDDAVLLGQSPIRQAKQEDKPY